MISFICAHCGTIAELDEDEILLDSGITFLCTCGKYTVVDLRSSTAEKHQGERFIEQRLHPEDEQMPFFKAVYENTNGMISTFGDYASTVDGFVLRVLFCRGSIIKRLTEILKLDSASWKIVECDADIGKYNGWLSVYKERAEGFSTGWGAACTKASEMALDIGEHKLADRLLSIASDPDLRLLLLPEIEGQDKLLF